MALGRVISSQVRGRSSPLATVTEVGLAIRFVLSDAYTSMSREERQSLLHEGASTATTLSAYGEATRDLLISPHAYFGSQWKSYLTTLTTGFPLDATK